MDGDRSLFVLEVDTERRSIEVACKKKEFHEDSVSGLQRVPGTNNTFLTSGKEGDIKIFRV